MEVKDYKDVKIGDEVLSCETHRPDGIIVWKGKASELTEEEIADWGMTAGEIDEEYDLVKVEDKTCPFPDTILYNYDGDPCGVYCKI